MTKPALQLIAAIDRRGAIGRDNALPWHLPDDLKRFKALTLGQPILMGRKTAESIGRALPGRQNLVLTRSGHAPFAGMQAMDSLTAALAAAGTADVLWVIGGGEIYAATMPLAQALYLTEVDTELSDADAFFPSFDRREWQAVTRQRHPADARHAHAFDFVEFRSAAPSARAAASPRAPDML